jgi:CSLREA domain-containing protein
MIRSAAPKVAWVSRARTIALWLLALLVAASLGVLLGANPAHAKTFTVTSTSDGADVALNGICDASPKISEVCTLRAAIEEANNRISNPGADTINFNIPTTTDPSCNATTRICTISPASALPTITEALTINGYTQRPCSTNPAPCSRPNTSAVGTNSVLLIQLNGGNTSSLSGLIIEASNSVVRGLVINRFGRGISIFNSFATPNPANNRIEGNFIGTNAGGTSDLSNSGEGVYLYGSDNTTVGGTSRAARNLISGNDWHGVMVRSSGNSIQGNLIGTDRTGTQDVGNGGTGVESVEPNQIIGGDTAASANVIAFNRYDGVAVSPSYVTGNAILRNSIFSNDEQGIDLGRDNWHPPNDPGDEDQGPNNFQNFPEVSSAETVGAITTIKARLNSTPSTQFVVRFFSNPSNEDEGKKYLGQMSVDTDANGNTGTFTFSPEQRVGLGQRITATVTDPANNTSEFSAPCEVKGGVIGGL